MFRRLAVTLAALALSVVQAAAAPVQVQVAEGRLAGESTDGVAVFKGVPFAAPPVGELRWRPPAAVQGWSGVRAADRFAASCMQPTISQMGPWTQEFFARPPFSEDCLYLNVWSPTAPGRKRPVMVWLHGGGLNQGGTSLPLYDGAALARRGVVVVSVNYRVGPFGFLAHPELTAEAPHRGSGNYGLMDQQAALRWVRVNIAAFGGDPEQVTLFGQSAGARSVTVHMLSPSSKGLFQRAIAQSGVQAELAGGMMRAATLADAEQRGLAFMRSAGARSLADLRALAAEAIQGVEGFREGVVVDGWMLPAPPAELIARGGLADVPFLTGYNLGEGTGPDGHARTVAMAAAWLRARASQTHTPAWFYDYDHVLPGPTASQYGAFHSAELPYVFGTLAAVDRPFTDADRAVAEQVQAYWVNFARKGDPNGAGLPRWPAFEAAKPMVMQIGDRPGARPVAEPAP